MDNTATEQPLDRFFWFHIEDVSGGGDSRGLCAVSHNDYRRIIAYQEAGMDDEDIVIAEIITVSGDSIDDPEDLIGGELTCILEHFGDYAGRRGLKW